MPTALVEVSGVVFHAVYEWEKGDASVGLLEGPAISKVYTADGENILSALQDTDILNQIEESIWNDNEEDPDA